MNEAIGRNADCLEEFDAFVRIERGYAEPACRMCQARGSLSFFLGVDPEVGVGHGPTAREAGVTAKHALGEWRAAGTDVESGL